MRKTPIDYLKERLTDGLKIISVEEASDKYKVIFEYEGIKTWSNIPKACSLHELNRIVKIALFTVYTYHGDREKADNILKQL